MTRDPGSRHRGSELLENVAGLLGEAPGSSREVVLADLFLDLGEDLVQDGPLSGRLRIDRTNRGVRVTGRAGTTLEQSCSRCLRPVSVAIDVRLDEEVLPSIELATGQPVRLEDEPDVARLTDHHEVDLEPLLREAVLLGEPIAPLCRPDCPGLCLVCGEELAGGPHEHGEAPIDPRLEALRAFRRDDDADTG